uniref:MCL1 apoptosis regulator, BCL2 family member n=1 Tax=Anser brachyrhynchus TaxID=132585 RepID=A0A8B9BNC2_9AVES
MKIRGGKKKRGKIGEKCKAPVRGGDGGGTAPPPRLPPARGEEATVTTEGEKQQEQLRDATAAWSGVTYPCGGAQGLFFWGGGSDGVALRQEGLRQLSCVPEGAGENPGGLQVGRATFARCSSPSFVGGGSEAPPYPPIGCWGPLGTRGPIPLCRAAPAPQHFSAEQPGGLPPPLSPPAGGDGGKSWNLFTYLFLPGVLLRAPVSEPASLAGMLRKLEIKKEEDLQSVGEVAAHVFSDGVTNWGRVVTLISFGAFVAKHLKSIKQEKCIGSLARIITDALVSSKREWLLSQGGWEGFVDFFRVEDLEGSIRNVLMAFAGVAGLGASLAYMIR